MLAEVSSSCREEVNRDFRRSSDRTTARHEDETWYVLGTHIFRFLNSGFDTRVRKYDRLGDSIVALADRVPLS